MLTGVRRGRWSGLEADEAFLHLRKLPVQFLDDRADLDRAWELSRRYDEHPIYGMLYVALAQRLGQQLSTADRALRRHTGGLSFVAEIGNS